MGHVVRGAPLRRTRRMRWMFVGIMLCADAHVWRGMWGLLIRNRRGTGRDLEKTHRTMLASGVIGIYAVYIQVNKHVPLARHSFEIASSATKARTSSMYVRASSVCRTG